MNRFLAYAAVLSVMLFASTSTAATCPKTITIDSVSYSIPGQWLGLCVDSSRLARSEDLVKLPDRLCYQGYRIFVTPETREAFTAMAAAAAKDSVHFSAKSGFRSFAYQKKLLRQRMNKGTSFTEACRYVAPPGFSEHETGTALDLAVTDGPFAKSAAYRWLRANGYRFGFVETYPDDAQSQLPWEPWHWCYNPQRAAERAEQSPTNVSAPN